MKRTDLEKSVGQKINNSIRKGNNSGPFNNPVNLPDKREQRKLDQARGLVPFAVKISIDLVQQIQDIAEEEQVGVNEVVARLLQKALEDRK